MIEELIEIMFFSKIKAKKKKPKGQRRGIERRRDEVEKYGYVLRMVTEKHEVSSL